MAKIAGDVILISYRYRIRKEMSSKKSSRKDSFAGYSVASQKLDPKFGVFGTKYLPDGKSVKVLSRDVFEGALQAASKARHK